MADSDCMHLDPMVPRTLRRAAATLRHEVKIFAGQRPWAYDLLFRWRPAYRDLVVTDTTDVCIEGFPRSADRRSQFHRPRRQLLM